MAVTGIDGQSRTSDEVVERPLQVRYDQKMAKYGHLAQQRDEEQVGDALFTSNESGQDFVQFRSLSLD